MVSMYKLDQIASKVRRTDEQGRKIEANKLRKSYESKIKDLKISGKNKSTKDENRTMFNMWFQYGDVWDRDVVGQNDMMTAGKMEAMLNSDVFKAKLASASKMEKGKLPRAIDDAYRPLLGNDDVVAPKPTAMANAALPGGVKKLGVQQPPTRPASPAPGAGRRPERSGKKRSYAESSFKGYGEGYADDDIDSDADGSVAQKRRRKVG